MVRKKNISGFNHRWAEWRRHLTVRDLFRSQNDLVKSTISLRNTTVFIGIIFFVVSMRSLQALEIRTHNLTSPQFIGNGEKLEKRVNGNIYFVGTDYEVDIPGGKAKKHTVTKLYFSKQGINTPKTVEIFPKKSSYPILDSSESFNSYHVFYRRYLKNKKQIKDVILLDDDGNKLWEGSREREQEYFWNQSTKHVLAIYPNEGEVKVLSNNGSVLESRSFTSHKHDKDFSEVDQDEDYVSFDYKLKSSPDGQWILINRSEKEKFNELSLLDVRGKTVFKKDFQATVVCPLFVSGAEKVFIVACRVYQGQNIVKEWMEAGNFSGEKLWSISKFDYVLSDEIDASGNMRLKSSEWNNHILTLIDTDQKLNIRTGTISK